MICLGRRVPLTWLAGADARGTFDGVFWGVAFRQTFVGVWWRARKPAKPTIVAPELRAALDDPRTRYRIVDAWRRRKAREGRP